MFDGQHIITWIILLGSVVLLASVCFALISLVQRKKTKVFPHLHLGIRKPKTVQVAQIEGVRIVEQKLTISGVDTLLSHRLEEAQETLKRYHWQEKINIVIDSLLIFGQYIIGGVLTVSFVQSTLSQKSLGFIGVLVLLATLLRQTYRPDIRERIAKNKVVFLKTLIRKTENLMTLSNGQDLQNALGELTEGLNVVDREEEWEEENRKQTS